MAKIPICPAIEVSRSGSMKSERGMTLFELLIALAIFATATTFAGVALTANLRHLAFNSATERLVDDLRRSQVYARTRDQAVVIELTANGYVISPLSTHRDWPSNVEAVWRVRRNGRWNLPGRVTITPDRLSPLQLEVLVSQGDDERHIRLDPVTGRVHVE
jgi:prepilin-type N-terminal cleavage/methylation domain-containing protein